jgi:single-stranded DNA-binding protein
MPSFAEVRILGYVSNDVQLRAGPKVNYLQLNIGVQRVFKDRKKPENPKYETRTRYLKTMIFGEYAVYLSERLVKGDLVHVSGELEVNERTVEGKKTWETYVLAKHVIPMAPRKGQRDEEPPQDDDNEEHIPF